MGPFGASVFLSWKCSICFWGLRASVLHLIRQRARNPNCLRKGRGAGVSPSHDRWVEVKTLIVAFGGGSDSLSYLPSQQRKISLRLHSSRAGTSLKKTAEARNGRVRKA